MPFFDLIVFVRVKSRIRIERLKKREIKRYGNRILPEGDRYKESAEFIEWASKYDLEQGQEEIFLNINVFSRQLSVMPLI